MKILHDFIESVKPNFEKGGKLEKWHPMFEAFETLAFVPATTTTSGTHIKDAIDMKRTMITVVLALIPCLLFGMWNTGHQHFLAFGMEADLMETFMFGFWKVLPLIIVSYAVGLGVEFLYSVAAGHPVSEGYLVSGMLIPLTLPVTVPLWMVALGAVFCTLLGKEIFGGTGYNFMNPALLARAFMFFAFPAFMSGEVWTDLSAEAGNIVLDGYSGATNLAIFDTNHTLMDSASNMFMGFEQGAIGETSVIACLIGAALLIYTGIGSLRIMLSVFAGGLLMGFVMNGLVPEDTVNHAMSMPALNHLLVGGFAFGAIFMATDPVTASHTAKGKIIYGVLIGAFTVLLRVFNPAYPEGMMLSILLFNVFAPLIDHMVVESHIKKRLKHA